MSRKPKFYDWSYKPADAQSTKSPRQRWSVLAATVIIVLLAVLGLKLIFPTVTPESGPDTLVTNSAGYNQIDLNYLKLLQIQEAGWQRIITLADGKVADKGLQKKLQNLKSTMTIAGSPVEQWIAQSGVPKMTAKEIADALKRGDQAVMSEQAYNDIKKMTGKQFDATIANAAMRLFERRFKSGQTLVKYGAMNDLKDPVTEMIKNANIDGTKFQEIARALGAKV